MLRLWTAAILLAASLAFAGPATAQVQDRFVACIELSGDAATRRDVKLRERGCEPGEQRFRALEQLGASGRPFSFAARTIEVSCGDLRRGVAVEVFNDTASRQNLRAAFGPLRDETGLAVPSRDVCGGLSIRHAAAVRAGGATSVVVGARDGGETLGTLTGSLAVFAESGRVARIGLAVKSSAGSFKFVTRIDAGRFEGGDAEWHQSLELKLPASDADVRALRGRLPESETYWEVVARLFERVGVLGQDAAVEQRESDRRDRGEPRLSIADGTATIVFALEAQPWSVEKRDEHYSLKLVRREVARAVPGVVELLLSGLKVRSVSPVAQRDDGGRRVEWAVNAGRETLTVALTRESSGWLTKMRVGAGWFGLLEAPAAFAPLFALFALAWVIARRARRGVPTAAYWLAGLSKVGGWVVGLLIVAWWLYVPREKSFDPVSGAVSGEWLTRLDDAPNALALASTAVVASILAVSAAAVTGQSRRLIRGGALAFALLAIPAALLAADAGSQDPAVVKAVLGGRREIGLAVAAGVVVGASCVLAYAALGLIAARLGAQVRGAPLRRRAVLWMTGLAGLLGLVLAGHWILGTYVESVRDPDPEGYVGPLLRFEAPFAGLDFAAAFLYAVRYLLFLALLALLRAASTSGPPISVSSLARWVRWAIALVFAAFVVGLGGRVDRAGLPLPLPFAVSFIVLALLLRRRPVAAASASSPGDWWAKGSAAARLSLPVAAIPFVFYTYLLLRSRLGNSVELDSSPDLPYIVNAILGEATFWVAAALVLGWLRPYLPGNTILQGLLLASLYAVSVGAGDLLLAGFDPDWTFRALVVVLFYVAIAIRVDYSELAEGEDFFTLLARYHLDKWRGRAAYAAPALLALAGIFQQLYYGDVQGAGRDIFANLQSFIPNVH